MIKKATSGLPFAGYVVPVLPGTPEAAQLLQPAYHLTEKEARQLVAAREANPAVLPWDEYQRAKAFLAALNATPVVVSTDAGWERNPERK